MRRWRLALGLVAVSIAPLAARGEGILFLDRCAEGCSYSPGFDDSRTNASSLISHASQLGAFGSGDASWNAVVDCVRATFGRFDIEVTDVDPGQTSHFEVAVAGFPTQLGFPNGVGNVSPITCAGDRVVNDGIAFAFANVFGDVPLEVCWSASQAAGGLLGLDHALLATDVMTSLSGPLPKVFEDQTASCGEFVARECSCGGTTQNSYQWLLTTLPEPDVTARICAAFLTLVVARRRIDPR